MSVEPWMLAWPRRAMMPPPGRPMLPSRSCRIAAVRTTSACGVCGKTSIRDICVLPRAALAADPARFEAAVLASLPDRLRDAQRVVSRTGGLHAAGLFTAEGDLIAVRQDVGRHNAVDKIGGGGLLT